LVARFYRRRDLINLFARGKYKAVRFSQLSNSNIEKTGGDGERRGYVWLPITKIIRGRIGLVGKKNGNSGTWWEIKEEYNEREEGASERGLKYEGQPGQH